MRTTLFGIGIGTSGLACLLSRLCLEFDLRVMGSMFGVKSLGFQV